MIVTIDKYNEMFNRVAREFVGRVELLEGSTILNTFEYDGALQSFVIEKAGDSTKFFGYGICQKATVKLRDKERAITVTKGQGLQIAHGIGTDYVYTYPVFYVDEVTRDENTNDLTIIGYDAIYKASSYKISDVALPETYTLRTFIHLAAAKLGMPVSFENVSAELLNLEYSKSTVNVEGHESLRSVLDDAAEVLGAIYYLNSDWELTFKTLSISGSPVLAINKSRYFTLSAKTAVTLQNIMSTTELGDNILASAGSAGETQYLRENVFLTLRDDIADILNTILPLVAGLTIYQFDCKHRGDFRLEIGDKISLITKDNAIVYSYLLNDTITYNGGLVGQTQWHYSASESESESTPSTVGEAISRTYAKVDKVNREITLVASHVDELETNQSELVITTENISAQVSQTTQLTNDAIDGLTQNMNTLTQKVSQTITAENMEIAVEQALSNGVSTVTTKTGFTFDSEGLTISKTGSEMETQITEDGMTVYRGGTAMLVADNTGVEAKNLSASTYLIVGANSRFENYGSDRTGCFWIGK